MFANPKTLLCVACSLSFKVCVLEAQPTGVYVRGDGVGKMEWEVIRSLKYCPLKRSWPVTGTSHRSEQYRSRLPGMPGSFGTGPLPFDSSNML